MSPIGPVGEFGPGVGSSPASSAGFVIGQQAVTNNVTSSYNSGSMAANTWTAAAGGGGTAPAITMPNDGATYRVEYTCSEIVAAVAGVITIGIGTSAAAASQLGLQRVNGNAGQVYQGIFVVPGVTGSGQALSIYVKSSGTSVTVNFNVGTIGNATGNDSPSYLTAYRVA